MKLQQRRIQLKSKGGKNCQIKIKAFLGQKSGGAEKVRVERAKIMAERTQILAVKYKKFPNKKRKKHIVF